uniref:A1L transcription factor/late transcription factor VLTF-2 n=1 Tax=Pithovirus LCPAC404 TaxID=2506597 RepID=A0A481ZBM1_9VIRU|nr:MAG: A1L transcription factor/late transcription factor VLTF-2 [Pithovirus LCPAC404]
MASIKSHNFLLRGIKSNEVQENYINGDYRNLDMKDITKRTIPKFSTDSDKLVAKDGSDIFIVKERGKKIVMVLRGHKVYTMFENIGKFPDAPCLWCKDVIKGNPVGNPVGEPIVKSIDNKCYICYYIIDLYCSFPCLYAMFDLFYEKTEKWSKIEQNILFLFSMMHPGEILRPAEDWRLLNINGGPLTSEQFHKGDHIFEDTGEILFLPAQSIYRLCNG